MKGNVSEFFNSFVTDTPADLQSDEAISIKSSIYRYLGDAIYVYSFREEKMLYTEGWEEVVGFADKEMTMKLLVNLTVPEFSEFTSELKDKALIFMISKTLDIEQYGYMVELKVTHKNGAKIPVVINVSNYGSDNGKLDMIIGRYSVNHSLTFGKFIRYALYGPDINELEFYLNTVMKFKNMISEKQREALSLIANGYTFKEVAAILNVSISAIEKRIMPLYERFDVKGLSHLVSFAYENNILP